MAAGAKEVVEVGGQPAQAAGATAAQGRVRWQEQQQTLGDMQRGVIQWWWTPGARY